jgi:hypothetical protein
MLLAADIINRALGSTMFWGGLAVGIPTGIAFHVMRSAWNAHKTLKATVPKVRKAAWAGVRGFIKFAVFIAVLVLASLAWLIGYHGPGLIPSVVPSLPPHSSSSPR